MSILTREPVVKGMFYPAKKDNLSKMISSFLIEADTKPDKEKELLGLIAPHAGYVYSGQCAAYAYKQLKGRSYDTVIVIGPSHSTTLEGASLWQKGKYATPMGDIEIDEDTTDFLLKQGPDIEFYQIAHMQEHSVEVQIPFLQYVLKNNFKLVPIVIGNQTLDYSSRLADSLYNYINNSEKNILVVASSDLSHYHTDDVAKRMDKNVIDLIKRKMINPLSDIIEAGKGEACGIGPIFTLLCLADKYNTDKIEILDVTNSGEVSGDKDRVVGYMSAAVYK